MHGRLTSHRALDPTVVIVDPRPSASAALEALLVEDLGWQVVGRARDGLEGLRLSREQRADVLLADAGVRGIGGAYAFSDEDPGSRPLVVRLLDFPHQFTGSADASILKGAPMSRLRDLVVALLDRATEDVCASPAEGGHS